MDAIVLGGQNGRTAKEIPKSFVEAYLNVVFEGARKGNAEAVRRLFELTSGSSDG